MKGFVRSFAAVVVATLLFAGCEGNITGPPSSETEISESAAVSHQSCAVTVENGQSIQDAVNAASPGDNVCVDGGTYEEQIVINKDLRLTGVNDPTIKYPDDAVSYAIVESQGSTWEPIIFAYGGTADANNNNEVSGTETIDVSVSGFTIDGRDMQPDAQRKVGIFFRNVQSTGAIANNTVENMGVGGKETFGILAYGDTGVAIADNTVSEYERGGIGANGDGGAHPSPEVTIANNEVTGSTGIGEGWGPNGIQVGYGASGKVTDNVVKDNRYSTSGGVASCILIFESDKASVKRNSVSNCDAGLAVGTYGSFRASADGNELVQNEVSEAIVGVSMEVAALNTPDYPFRDISNYSPSLTNNKVVNNEMNGDEIGQTGIEISTFNLSSDYDPVADNNKLINNAVTGFDSEVDESGSDTKVQANGPATP